MFHIFVEWKWLEINKIISHGCTVNSIADAENQDFDIQLRFLRS